jgi:hypothetical protein
MFSRQRWPIALIAILCIGCERPHQESVPPGIVTAARVAIAELNRASDEAAVLAAARALMLADSNAALITVDPQGQPRARTVFTLLERPDPLDRARGVTAWIMTRAGSRKLDQIRRNPNVTLYYSDDANVSYASVVSRI